MSVAYGTSQRASLAKRVGTAVAGCPVGLGGLSGVAGQRAAQGSIVERLHKKNRKPNTALAFDPKAREWFQYCKDVYCHEAEYQRYTVTSDKLHNFLFYHAFRNKYNRKEQNGEKTNKGEHGFDFQDYQDVTSKYVKHYEEYLNKIRKGELQPDDDDDATMPEPSNPIGQACMNTYLHAVKNIYKKQVSVIQFVIQYRFRVFQTSTQFSNFLTHFLVLLLQVEQGCNNLVWEHIQTRTVDSLIAMVQQRKARIAKATYQEKLDCDFTPYAQSNNLERIEERFFQEGYKTNRAAYSSIRHRMVLLNCYSGVLRHETVYNGELSDLLCINHHDQRAQSDQLIQVMQIGIGKSTCRILKIFYFKVLTHSLTMFF